MVRQKNKRRPPKASAPSAPSAPSPVVAPPRDAGEHIRSRWGAISTGAFGGFSGYMSFLGDTAAYEPAEQRREYPQMVAKDGIIKSALLTRLRSVASLDLTVVPASKSNQRDKFIAEGYRAALLGLSGGPGQIGLKAIVYNVGLPAFIEGHSLCDFALRRQVETRGRWKQLRMVECCKSKAPGTYQALTDEFGNLTGVRDVSGGALGAGRGEVYPAELFIYYTFMSLYGNLFGTSELRAAFLLRQQKQAAMVLRMAYLDKATGGLLVAQDVPEGLQKVVMEALLLARGCGAITLPIGVKASVEDIAQGSEAVFSSAMEYFDRGIAVAVAGASLQILEGRTTNGRGDSKVQRGIAELAEWELASDIGGLLTLKAGRWVDENFAGADYPEAVKLAGIDPSQTLAEMKVAKVMHDMGQPMSKMALAERGNWPLPTTPDDTLPGAPLKPQAGPGAPGGPPAPGGFADDPPSDGGGGPDPKASGPTSPAKSGDDVALAGKDVAQAATLLRASIRDGSRVLSRETRRAVKRLVRNTAHAAGATRLFSTAARQRIADSIAAVNATGELLGAARIRLRLAKHRAGVKQYAEDATDFGAFADRPPLRPLPPATAAAAFRAVVPGLAVDAGAFADRLGREAFTLAATTDEVLLGKVRAAIDDAINRGVAVETGAGVVREILDAAGVGPTSPAYARMVYHTNAMSHYNAGGMRELQSPDVAAAFPTWMFAANVRPTSRPEHAARNGEYYPVSVSFMEVRGTDAESVCGCCCSFVPVSAGEWEELQAAGTAFAAYAERFCGGPGSGVPGPCPTGAAGQRAATLAGRVKELPGRVAAKARSYVAAKYQQLSARYGAGYAKAIVGAGILSAPIPLPGASLLAAAPLLLIAEAHLRLSAGHADAPAGVTLSPAEVKRLGAAFVRELLAGWKADAKGMP
jgi:hypothetical protein